MSDSNGRKPSLASRLAHALRPKKSTNKLRKQSVDPAPPTPPPKGSKPLQHGAIYRPADSNRDEQTGERRDDTDLLHGLAHHESNSSLDSYEARQLEKLPWRPPGDGDIATLPAGVWQLIVSHYLSPSTAASLAFSSRTIYKKLGRDPFFAVDHPSSAKEKLHFLETQDYALPAHLLCYTCGIYHLRLSPGTERLRPTLTPNLIVNCPLAGKPSDIATRARLTPTYTLPFALLLLALRYAKHSPNHGIPLSSLNKRWKASPPLSSEIEWVHQSRYYIHHRHLLLRLNSWSFAAADLPLSGMRHLLYDREGYTPYFSACTHWRDGVLMDVAKCALSHIPPEVVSVREQLRKSPRVDLSLTRGSVTQCSFCRPMRRCTECPSEYLVEIKKVEDREAMKFRWAISVTRWCDFGDGVGGPAAGEWAAVCGAEGERYDSFARMGKRAISGIFESQSGVTMPGQRMMSLNPKGEKRGEDGSGWY